VTFSDESEEEETPAQNQKFLTFVTPHEDQEDSQSYYLESSDEDAEELKEAFVAQHHVQKLNILKTERSTLLIKIQDLEEKLL
jgi:GTP-dependent phosphoenolpyruvate carboxykinase